MPFFNLNFENKTLIIFISSIIMVINFRTTFKNIDLHMDIGSYASLKYNPRLILIKNIIGCFFLVFFYYDTKLGQTNIKKEITTINKIQKDDIVVFEEKKEFKEEGIFDSIYISHRLKNKRLKFCFFFKNFLIIFFIYIIEEAYFIIGNNHIMDRIICAIRNLAVFLGLLLFYPLIFKKCYVIYRHQIIPLIIIIIVTFSLIMFTSKISERFPILFNVTNISIYGILFLLMALEMILIKYLLDKQFLNLFLVMGIKGIIGTIIFIVINIFYNELDSIKIFDPLLHFEFENLYEKFDLVYQILYIISMLIIQFFKMYTINQFTETHYLYTLMIADIIFFPFYCLERIYIQKFEITTKILFGANIAAVIINLFLILIINEILECNCCNFSNNLKRSIFERQISDMMSAFN